MKIGNITLKNPVFLAPMAGITDMPFRVICKEQGADFLISEMVSSRGIVYNDIKTTELLTITDFEHPMAIQIFGNEPQIMAEAAVRALKFNPDAIDINMGCPTRKIAGNGDGCSLMRDPILAAKICIAVVKAVNIPVTVKIRKGWDNSSINAKEFARLMQESGAGAITVHGRTKEQTYAQKADWDIIAEVKETVKIPVIGNGDIFSGLDAKKMLDYTKCDGVMIGRGALGNPWIFTQAKAAINGDIIPPVKTVRERLGTALLHIKMLVEYKGEFTGIREARKHVSWYVKGIKGASAVKNEVNSAISLLQMEEIILRVMEENN